MKKALIISGGEYCLPDKASIKEYDYIIACDKGIEYAYEAGLYPDLILGDMDSSSLYANTTFPKSKIITYPALKDDTDTLLAIKEAIRLKIKKIDIICALGGRLDHTLANIQSLAFAAKAGCNISIISKLEHLIVLSQDVPSIIMPNNKNHSLSLFALSEKVQGLTIRGSAYDVENICLLNSYPIGVSNKWVEDNVKISIKDGILLIISSFSKDL